jgi:hypothetical protein
MRRDNDVKILRRAITLCSQRRDGKVRDFRRVMESTTASHEAETACDAPGDAEGVKGAPGQPALATVAGDQCTSCGAPLAPDQRYCVRCGQRRGQSRLPVAQPVAAAAPVRESRMPRLSHNAALIAGVGTLLLAMGVGVLIGRSGEKSPSSASAAPQVITVGGAGGTANTAAAGGAAAGAKGKAKAKSTGKKATAAQAQSAANKIKGTSVKLPKKAVVTVGTPGTGPGYQHGKFTGNFFGGG